MVWFSSTAIHGRCLSSRAPHSTLPRPIPNVKHDLLELLTQLASLLGIPNWIKLLPDHESFFRRKLIYIKSSSTGLN